MVNDNGATDTDTTTPRRRSVVKIVAVDPETNEEKEAQARRMKRIIWRDFAFLILAGIGAHIMSYIELHASEAELRGGESTPSGVVDTGFILTTPAWRFLKERQGWNDFFAALNSIALFVPGIYTVYITLWKGDFDLSFRYFATHLLRSFCGWFTYLPPDPSYLPSNYDFPDIWQCVLVKDCSQTVEAEVLPFVSFFSGHVSTMTCTANHMYVHGYWHLAVFCHVMNALQILRLLATRGHYSIDMIIAWYVAVYVSNPAGRLGRYYSRGKTMSDVMPATPAEAFETLTGVTDVKNEVRMSRLMKKKDFAEALQGLEDEDIQIVFESETTATLLAEGKLDDLIVGDKQKKENEKKQN